MNNLSPILITGAGGEVGSVSGDIARRLLAKGYPVRAFVRTDDERADALRAVGAEVFVGDLLKLADVAQALRGCRRVFFTMSLSPYYLDANLVMVAAARAANNIEVLVNISDIEQSYMTYEHMAAPREHRLKWLGGLVDDYSPQQRAHWLAEQAVNWSGLPAVQIRATFFIENPLLTWFPVKRVVEKGELLLPFAGSSFNPIAATDVAEACAHILIAPEEHIGQSYALTGPELKNMDEVAADFSAVLGKEIRYVAQSLESSDQSIDSILTARNAHAGEHLKALTRLIAGGRYEEVTDTLTMLIGRTPTTLRQALAKNVRLQQARVTSNAG
ncbi:NAD(P)H-binding protein [Pseudomonas sp. CBMAI 2609]|uniref:NAD(P)H-binding protein n=1 Tax=Pseudomonas flavocrustae TaxID=2991719 RepID=A0ABT6IKP8_9PSED|nr:NAD(P)H-binding protein [Pseudomonas sp. CBMAI 2609]MDH4764165.1 NAD(P)H-binding protein [Pseudomonas sp. CBMAI 2609]